MKRQSLFVLMAVLSFGAFAQFEHQRVYSTFDNLPLAKADTFNNGVDESNGFTHYNRYWNNTYHSWGGFSGWALSNMTDTVTAGFTNQYSAITGSGVSRTSNYMISTGDGAYIKLDKTQSISGAYFTNSTYAARDMEQGSGFSKKFGGDDGSDPDYFLLKIYTYLDNVLVDSVDFYLADFRDADNSKDYIIKDWTFVDFNNDPFNDILIDSISFRYEGSDVGEFGLNTPKYFCMDDFNAISTMTRVDLKEQPFDDYPADTFYNGSDNSSGFLSGYLFFENNFNSDWNSWSGWSLSSMLDDTTQGFGNQFSCINDREKHFYVAGGQHIEIRAPYLEENKNALFKITQAPWSVSISITNTTYAALDMKNGSGFSKKFGGDSGNDPDYLRLKISYVNAEGIVNKMDTIYLADFRFDDNSKDYILEDWRSIKTPGEEFKGENHKITFDLESSDNGMFGMNTPAYFCLSYEYNIPASIQSISNEINVLAYPNPTSFTLNLQAEDMIENVQIVGLDGRVLINSTSTTLSKNMSVNIAELAPGIYFAVVTTAKGTATKRFIKQ